MSFVFSVLSGACSVYLFICFIRVILTWVPNAQYSSFGRFLAALCDPYLSWFRRFSFLRAGMLDFSPAVAMGVLVALSSVFAQLSLQGRILFGASLATLLGVLWSIVASLLGFFILLLMIRLFVVIFWPNSSSQLWQAVPYRTDSGSCCDYPCRNGRQFSDKYARCIAYAPAILSACL